MLQLYCDYRVYTVIEPIFQSLYDAIKQSKDGNTQIICIFLGYYADSEAECQVFHICTADGQGGLSKYSFLCPNGTIFNQNYFICDWWFNFDCAEAEALAAEKNAELAAEREAASGSADDQSSYGAASDDSYAAPADVAEYEEYEYDTEAPADAYGAPTELPAYDYEDTEAPLDSYGATTAAPAGYLAPQEERRRRTFGRAGRRLNGRRNGRRPAGQRQFRG